MRSTTSSISSTKIKFIRVITGFDLLRWELLDMLGTRLIAYSRHRVAELFMLQRAMPDAAENFAFGYQKGGFSATTRSPSETIMNIFCVYIRFNRRLCDFNSRGFARSCNMSSALTGQFVQRFCVGARHKCSPEYPFFLHPLPPPHDIGLTPRFKTLQSP